MKAVKRDNKLGNEGECKKLTQMCREEEDGVKN